MLLKFLNEIEFAVWLLLLYVISFAVVFAVHRITLADIIVQFPYYWIWMRHKRDRETERKMIKKKKKNQTKKKQTKKTKKNPALYTASQLT